MRVIATDILSAQDSGGDPCNFTSFANCNNIQWEWNAQKTTSFLGLSLCHPHIVLVVFRERDRPITDARLPWLDREQQGLTEPILVRLPR